jgi:hypothetical protein
MHFKVKNLVLWPKITSNEVVNIEFDLDKVNVITGGSSRGKSAILAIIDYCLGASICRIPTRKIRDKTEWFGIVIQLTNNNTILLARKEPGEAVVSNEMFMRESSLIEIPVKVSPNINVQQAKRRLDDLAGLPQLGFSESEDDDTIGFKSRPSFRDLVSFNFQPQYLIANQSTLFYKTDIFQNKEKLRTIFPYVLQAVNDEYLRNKEELKDCRRQLNALTKDLDKRRKLVERWIGELKSNYVRAIEFGILPDAPLPDENWGSQVYISYLKGMPKDFNNKIPVIKEGISVNVSDRINELEDKEIELSHSLHTYKHRYELIKRLEISNQEYRGSLLKQHGRLKSVDWFSKLLEKDDVCPLCSSRTNNSKEAIQKLKKANLEIVQKGSRTNDNITALLDETSKLRRDISDHEQQINSIRKEIQILKGSDAKIDTRLQNIFSIYRFAGNLEVEIKNYEEYNEEGEIREKIKKLEQRINDLELTLNESLVEQRLKRAKRKIEDVIKFYADLFQAEHATDSILFDEKNLTISFVSINGRENALYEIGGGSNFLAYHISSLLALHEFFVSLKKTPVPGFVIFDQPSQVFFPDKSDSESASDEDVIKVRRIFEAFSKFVERSKGSVQVIVIEHVGEYAWEGLTNINKLRRWRGEADDAFLIPLSWE